MTLRSFQSTSSVWNPGSILARKSRGFVVGTVAVAFSHLPTSVLLAASTCYRPEKSRAPGARNRVKVWPCSTDHLGPCFPNLKLFLATTCITDLTILIEINSCFKNSVACILGVGGRKFHKRP